MTGPSKAMKAAFPPKLSEGAERLKEAMRTAVTTRPYSVPIFVRTAQAIVTELGITPKMVEDVRPLVQPSTRAPHAMNQDAAAIALATLLEVAGQ